MHRIFFAASISIVSVLGVSSADAQGLLPYGHCAVVVASRPSVGEAQKYIQDYGWQNVARVFESSNGWLAITTNMINNTGSTATIARMKTNGQIPQDSYCSTEGLYVREVSWQSSDRASSPPVSRGLWAEFDARPLTQTEKRFLQAALAMEGFYNGLLDGVWGARSQVALERYSAANFDGVDAANAHAAFLIGMTFKRWLDEGWDYQYIRYLNLSMMLPVENLIFAEENGLYKEWHHSSKKMVVYFNDLDFSGLRNVHESVVNASDVIAEPYTLRGADTWVTSVQTTTGTVYLRSDLLSGSWSTVMVDAAEEMKSVVGLISSSIRAGSPVPIIPDEDGVLMRYWAELADVISDENDDAPSTGSNVGNSSSTPPDASDGMDRWGSTGTAFYVTNDGVALTNAHVVQDCTSIHLDGKPAEIVSVSASFDLAAIRLKTPKTTIPLSFSQGDAALNADITVAGYPLHGILGGLNVGRGSVSSLKGMRGDETRIQISAPVQPGNSGGPAIDRFGGVVAVVVSKLDTVALADATGDIAQNVNFAIRGSLAKVFLSSNGISYFEMKEGSLVAPEKAAELLQSATYLVMCDQN